MKKIPFCVIGTNELGEVVGTHAVCPHCKKKHPVKYGERVLPDGTKEPSKLLGYVKCGKKSYLVALNGRAVKKLTGA